MKKHVLITGASSGFGYSLVQKFLSDSDWIVHCTSRSGVIVDSVFSDEQKMRLFCYQLDLSSSASLSRLIETLRQKRISIHALVNNAGYGLFGALEDVTEEQIRRQFEVNFMGTLLLTKSLLSDIRNNKGHLITVSSSFGFQGFPLTSIYCATKFALEGWSEALRFELKPHGVKVTVVQPGAHRTQFAKNVEWGAGCFSEPSVFLKQNQGYRLLLDRLSRRKKFSTPSKVTNSVFDILINERDIFKVRIGKDSKLGYWLRRILPSYLYLISSDFLFTKLFKAKEA